jgi:hypothetical protein
VPNGKDMHKPQLTRIVGKRSAGFLLLSLMAAPLVLSKEAPSTPVVRLTPELLPEYKARVLSRSYASSISQLQEAIEFPRIGRDYCIATQPQTKLAVTELHASWEQRNTDFVVKAREQVKRASERLSAEGVPLSEAVPGIFRMLQATQKPKKFCKRYGRLLEQRDRHIRSELGQVLESLTRSEAELSRLATEQ